MTTSATPMPGVRAAFEALIDYAGLFPPAGLSVREAAAEYAQARQGAHSWMLGRFIVASARMPELLECLPGDAAVGLSTIVDPDSEALAQLDRLSEAQPRAGVQALETAVQADRIRAFARARASSRFSRIPAFVELARVEDWQSTIPLAMAELAEQGLSAKVRCGGLHRQAFPTPAELAAFVYWACRHKVPFKATAGLHHPIRHVDPAGFPMHGFLNLLTATALARSGESVEVLTQTLACEDPARFAFEQDGLRYANYAIGVRELQATRREAFVAYGSCSFAEPVDDLRAMGIL